MYTALIHSKDSKLLVFVEMNFKLWHQKKQNAKILWRIEIILIKARSKELESFYFCSIKSYIVTWFLLYLSKLSTLKYHIEWETKRSITIIIFCINLIRRRTHPLNVTYNYQVFLERRRNSHKNRDCTNTIFRNIRI